MKRTLLFAGLMTLLAIPSFAVVQIDFTNGAAGSGGQIIVSGSNVSGTNVLIGSLTVTGAGAADGVYDTTGTGAGLGNGSAVLNFNTATNFIEIIGGIDGQHCVPTGPTTQSCTSNTAVANGTTLLTGTFNSWSVLNTSSFGGLSNGVGPDTKSPLLLAALGLAPNTQFSFFAFNITGVSTGTGSPFTAISTDILNTSVPEPASIVLLGTVLFGVTQLLRRRAVTKV